MVDTGKKARKGLIDGGSRIEPGSGIIDSMVGESPRRSVFACLPPKGSRSPHASQIVPRIFRILKVIHSLKNTNQIPSKKFLKFA